MEELGKNTAPYIIDQVLIYITYKVSKNIDTLLTYRKISLVRSSHRNIRKVVQPYYTRNANLKLYGDTLFTWPGWRNNFDNILC